MVKLLLLTVFCVVFFSVWCSCSRILCVYPTPSISHQLVFQVYNEELLKRGHELVVITPNTIKENLPGFENLTQIDVHNVSYTIWNKYLNFANIRAAKGSNAAFLPTFFEVMILIMEEQLNHPKVKEMINNKNEHFDLVIVEGLTPTMFAFGERFNTPTISFLSFAAALQSYDAIGNPSHPLVYPDMFCPYVGELSFIQRVHLLYQDLNFRWVYYIQYLPRLDALAKKHFGNEMKDVGFLEKQVDLMFMNAQQIVMGIRPTVPGLIFLGSLHIRPTKPLPGALKKYLDDSKQGVIYFSLGTNVKSKDLPLESKNMLLQAFAELPYNVVWKYEDEFLVNIPDNVFISKWLPQQDLLGHPNIKVFLTQGGQQSMDEGLHHGVPMIAMPFLGDQDLNAGKMAHFGYGLHLDFFTLTKDSLKNSIVQVITNTKYRNNARRISKLMRDEPMTSAERAVWWTEYVIRHKGARHLRSPLVDFPFYKYIFLDIILFFSAILCVALVFIYCILKTIIRLATKTPKKSPAIVKSKKN